MSGCVWDEGKKYLDIEIDFGYIEKTMRAPFLCSQLG